MQHPNKQKFPTKLNHLIILALGVAAADGGMVIALQTITFLLTFFYGARSSTQLDIMGFFVPLFSMLSLAVIIFRITGLLRGIKYSLGLCYLNALRRWSFLVLLYLIGDVALLVLSKPILKLFAINHKFLIFAIFALIPYGLLACIFIVDQHKNPLQAILAAYNTVRFKISPWLLLSLSAIYSIPCFISVIIATPKTFPYLTLAAALWLLFCHILTIVIYVDSLDKTANIKSGTKGKETVVII